MHHNIDMNKITLADSNKISFHVATAEYRGKYISSRSNTAGVHAEVALLKSHNLRSYRNKKINIYVTRLSKNGHSMSRPCVACSRYIKAYWPLATVYYTNADGAWMKDLELDTNHLCLADRMSLDKKKSKRNVKYQSGSATDSSESSDLVCEECY